MWAIYLLLASGVTFAMPPAEFKNEAACEQQAVAYASRINEQLGVPAVVGYKCSQAA